MKKSAFFSDVFFTFFLFWLFTLCVFRYLRVALLPALFLSFVCGALAACAVAALLHGKRKSVFLKKSDEAQKQKLLLHLALLSDEGKTKLFSAALKTAKRLGKLRLQTEENFCFLRFSFAPVTADEVASLARFKTAKPKLLYCSELEESAKTLCKRLGIETKTGESVYRLFKEENALPQSYLGEETKQNKRKELFKVCFAKSNAKRFLFCGSLLLVTSLITPFPYYYLVFGGALLLVALFIRIFGKES
ncbi:MAG: hypothetical protein IJX88_03025 [Clostridia bacterium]|nr:hypothetical protein [Clostridia bacterium]